jgi:hypothetical protein
MEGQGKSRDRRLNRCYQGNRLEEQLWAVAYETVWPVVRRAVCGDAVAREPFVGDRIAVASRMARRA